MQRETVRSSLQEAPTIALNGQIGHLPVAFRALDEKVLREERDRRKSV